MEAWSHADVIRWVALASLPQKVAEVFREYEVVGEDLVALKDFELAEMGIPRKLLRTRIIAARNQSAKHTKPSPDAFVEDRPTSRERKQVIFPGEVTETATTPAGNIASAIQPQKQQPHHATSSNPFLADFPSSSFDGKPPSPSSSMVLPATPALLLSSISSGREHHPRSGPGHPGKEDNEDVEGGNSVINPRIFGMRGAMVVDDDTDNDDDSDVDLDPRLFGRRSRSTSESAAEQPRTRQTANAKAVLDSAPVLDSRFFGNRQVGTPALSAHFLSEQGRGSDTELEQRASSDSVAEATEGTAKEGQGGDENDNDNGEDMGVVYDSIDPRLFGNRYPTLEPPSKRQSKNTGNVVATTKLLSSFTRQMAVSTQISSQDQDGNVLGDYSSEEETEGEAEAEADGFRPTTNEQATKDKDSSNPFLSPGPPASLSSNPFEDSALRKEQEQCGEDASDSDEDAIWDPRFFGRRHQQQPRQDAHSFNDTVTLPPVPVRGLASQAHEGESAEVDDDDASFRSRADPRPTSSHRERLMSRVPKGTKPPFKSETLHLDRRQPVQPPPRKHIQSQERDENPYLIPKLIRRRPTGPSESMRGKKEKVVVQKATDLVIPKNVDTLTHWDPAWDMEGVDDEHSYAEITEEDEDLDYDNVTPDNNVLDSDEEVRTGHEAEARAVIAHESASTKRRQRSEAPGTSPQSQQTKRLSRISMQSDEVDDLEEDLFEIDEKWLRESIIKRNQALKKAAASSSNTPSVISGRGMPAAPSHARLGDTSSGSSTCDDSDDSNDPFYDDTLFAPANHNERCDDDDDDDDGDGDGDDRGAPATLEDMYAEDDVYDYLWEAHTGTAEQLSAAFQEMARRIEDEGADARKVLAEHLRSSSSRRSIGQTLFGKKKAKKKASKKKKTKMKAATKQNKNHPEVSMTVQNPYAAPNDRGEFDC